MKCGRNNAFNQVMLHAMAVHPCTLLYMPSHKLHCLAVHSFTNCYVLHQQNSLNGCLNAITYGIYVDALCTVYGVRNKSYLSHLLHLLHLVRYLTHDNYDYHQFCSQKNEPRRNANRGERKQHCTVFVCVCACCLHDMCALLVLAKF